VQDKLDPLFPARVWKLVGIDEAIVIDCGLHVKRVPLAQLNLLNYKGRRDTFGKYDKPASECHFLGMSRLRWLLKGARVYNPMLVPEKR